MTNAANDEGGFALVEALVGLAIFGLCMTAIVSLTSLWTSASERSRRNAAWIAKEQAVGNAFISSLENAVPYAQGRAGGLDGTTTDMRFLSASPHGSSSDTHVEIQWTYDNRLHRLRMTMTDDRGTQVVAAETFDVAVSFVFFARTPFDDRQIEYVSWKPDWPAPAFIELRISPANRADFISEARHYAVIRPTNHVCTTTMCLYPK